MSDHIINNDLAYCKQAKYTCSVGIFCTVSSDELQLAFKTLSIAARSEFVSKILILITDNESINENFISLDSSDIFSHKFEVECGNYGSGYETAIRDGGYDQVSARNAALDILYKKDVDWVMQHDADDVYDLSFYERICTDYAEHQAIMTECYTLNSNSSYIVNSKLCKVMYGKKLINPHIRVWKRELKLKFNKSKRVSDTYANETRHCGVEFPDGMKLILIKKPSHYHLHRLLNKRHSNFLDKGNTHEIKLEEELKEKLKTILL
ncbi:hypothetical protein [Rahnella perminowiae]|uniref:hypothetical protein n=1 Tax=Rahnella perminowiae TaxID=2816244 RepID=UPI00300E85BF